MLTGGRSPHCERCDWNVCVSARCVIISRFTFTGLFAKALDGVDIKSLVTNVGSCAGTVPAPAGAAEDAPCGDAPGICWLGIMYMLVGTQVYVGGNRVYVGGE